MTEWPHFHFQRGGFPSGAVVKNLPVNAGDARDVGLIPGLGRSPGVGNGNPLQYSCENPMDREELGGLQSIGSQRVGHNWATEHSQTHIMSVNIISHIKMFIAWTLCLQCFCFFIFFFLSFTVLYLICYKFWKIIMARLKDLVCELGMPHVREKRISETIEGYIILVCLGGREQHERNWRCSVTFTTDIESTVVREKDYGVWSHPDSHVAGAKIAWLFKSCFFK